MNWHGAFQRLDSRLSELLSGQSAASARVV
jgi:hypothetical protein